MRIRSARPDEAQLIGALHLRTALHAYRDIFPKEAPAPTVDELTEHWVSRVASGTTGLVACVDDVIVGMALAGNDDSDPSTGYLSRVYVDPDHQARGIGSALHNGCLNALRQRGFEQATLWVLERNVRGRAWYERLGWRATGERKPVYPPAGIDDVRYRLTSI